MLKRTTALIVLALIGSAEAQEKKVDELFTNFVRITDAIRTACDAAWPNNEDESKACWNAQAQAFASLANFAPASAEAAALLQCTTEYETWEQVDWVKAKQCTQGQPGQPNSDQSTAGQAAGGQEAVGQEAGGQQAGEKEAGGQEASGQETGGQATGGQAAGAQDAGGQESGTPTVDARNVDEILSIARGFGDAQIDKDSGGDPMIRGRIEGVSYRVFFYGCTQNRDCRNIQFYAGWDAEGITVERLNEWNRNKRFGGAYLDGENDPILEMDVNLDYGVTRKNLEDTFDWWRVILGEFTKEVINAA